jgi:Calpain family cysteine protease
MILHNEVSDPDNLWKQIIEAEQKSFVMATSVASDRSGQTNQAVVNLGLVDAHAYSLIAAKELTYNLKRLRLVKIRNPWG